MPHDTEFFRPFIPQWLRIWEHVPNVHFFIKDLRGRIMACNESFARLMGGSCEEDILGRTAFDLCAPQLAIRYTEDDQRVFRGEAIIDKYEPNVGDSEGIYWYLTTKLPLTAPDGRIVGLAGITRAITPESRFAEEVQPILDHIHLHYIARISFPSLARKLGTSVSTMERRFKRYFGISPRDYLMRYRVLEAARLLIATNHSIAEIAAEVGFYDQTTLTRQFRRHKGTTPFAWRRQHAR
ncbi:MAG: AraC family transcriptional regulator [Verrucomicrobia bacterium]|nr:MAG: AraC family transcriptional regulator [Verrucomicrobiota bacterium]